VARAAAGIRALAGAGPLIVVHGGGRAVDADLRARGLSPTFVDGLRITDAAALDSVVGVLAGRINTALAAALGAAGVHAVGLTGADAGLGICDSAAPVVTTTGIEVDLGRVGRPSPAASPRLVVDLLAAGYVPVVATIGRDARGALLNVNADVFAAWLAQAAGVDRLIVAGSTPGVFGAAGGPCDVIDDAAAAELVRGGAARDGMVAKLDACRAALAGGVPSVRIVDGREGDYALARGTTIVSAREVTRC
jgi:acetylglutamate kinase